MVDRYYGDKPTPVPSSLGTIDRQPDDVKIFCDGLVTSGAGGGGKTGGGKDSRQSRAAGWERWRDGLSATVSHVEQCSLNEMREEGIPPEFARLDECESGVQFAHDARSTGCGALAKSSS